MQGGISYHGGRMKKCTRIIASLVAMLALFAGSAVVAGPASAAVNYCNTMKFRSGTGTYVPYSSGAATYTCYMNANHKTRGDGVRQLQVSVNKCYGKSIDTDGVFGTETATALAAVQRRINAADDGKYGPETRNKMKWVSISNGVPTSVCHSY
jgi:peptidoglycan hydrolase-like protein with peptidoglycan-binding domain